MMSKHLTGVEVGGGGGQRFGPLERKEICNLRSGIIGCPRA